MAKVRRGPRGGRYKMSKGRKVYLPKRKSRAGVRALQGMRGSAPLPISYNKCLWGPNYWCQSASNAQKCNATSMCKQYRAIRW
jgi:hypothetical protein